MHASSEIAVAPRSSGDPSFCVIPFGAAHAEPSVRRGSCKPGHRDRWSSRSMVQMHAVQFSRIGTPADAAVRSDRFPSSRPPNLRRLPARAHSAPLTRASPLDEGRRGGVSIGSFSMLVGPLPPQRSWEYSPLERRVKRAPARIGVRALTAVRPAAQGEQIGAFQPSGPARTRSADSMSRDDTGSPSRLTPPGGDQAARLAARGDAEGVTRSAGRWTRPARHRAPRHLVRAPRGRGRRG